MPEEPRNEQKARERVGKKLPSPQSYTKIRTCAEKVSLEKLVHA
jgi:hypothetical protein